MQYYNLDQLLEATKCFANQKKANQRLNRALRRIEGKKQKIAQKNITEVSHDTFCEVMSIFTMCYSEVIIATTMKFAELGYTTTEK